MDDVNVNRDLLDSIRKEIDESQVYFKAKKKGSIVSSIDFERLLNSIANKHAPKEQTIAINEVLITKKNIFTNAPSITPPDYIPRKKTLILILLIVKLENNDEAIEALCYLLAAFVQHSKARSAFVMESGVISKLLGVSLAFDRDIDKSSIINSKIKLNKALLVFLLTIVSISPLETVFVSNTSAFIKTVGSLSSTDFLTKSIASNILRYVSFVPQLRSSLVNANCLHHICTYATELRLVDTDCLNSQEIQSVISARESISIIFRNIAAHGSAAEKASLYENEKVVGFLSHIITHEPSVDCLFQAFHALANCIPNIKEEYSFNKSNSSDIYDDLIGKSIAMLRTAESEHLKKSILYFLSHLIIKFPGADTLHQIYSENIVPLLWEFLLSSTTRCYSLILLRNMAKSTLYDFSHEFISVDVGYNNYLDLLKDYENLDKNSVHHLLSLLINLSSHDQVAKKYATQEYSSMVSRILMNTYDESIKKDCLTCLSNLCCTGEACLLILSMIHIKLRQIFYEGILKKECSILIYNATTQNNKCFKQFLQTEGFFPNLSLHALFLNDMITQQTFLKLVLNYLKKAGNEAVRMLYESEISQQLIIIANEFEGKNRLLALKILQVLDGEYIQTGIKTRNENIFEVINQEWKMQIRPIRKRKEMDQRK